MSTILITGADGTVGRDLVRLLRVAGADVRAGVHHLERPDSFPDVPRVLVDFSRPETLLTAMRGVTALYLLTPQVPQSVEYVRAAVSAAYQAGVRRIIRQSVFNALAGVDELSRWHRMAELEIESSGVPCVFLRPNSFMQNFITIYRREILGADRFRLPLGGARLSNVDVRDVADCAAVVLLDENLQGGSYELSGPAALTGDEMALVLSEVAGREIVYVDAPEDEEGVPRDETQQAVSEALIELGLEMQTGELATVTGAVQHLTGRVPISFEQFARDYAWAWRRPDGAAPG